MIWTALKSYFACAWSAFTYIFQGVPADKPSYWKNCLGFNDSAPNLLESWASYKAEPNFHHLKDLLVEWCETWPQRSAKLLALFGCLLGVLGMIVGGSIVGAVFCLA